MRNQKSLRERERGQTDDREMRRRCRFSESREKGRKEENEEGQNRSELVKP